MRKAGTVSVCVCVIERHVCVCHLRGSLSIESSIHNEKGERCICVCVLFKELCVRFKEICVWCKKGCVRVI